MLLPVERVRAFIDALALPAPVDEATELLLAELRSRLRFLAEVGLSYLTLDRQSRTLSGGEVQRINLTTALGTSLVNTLFVLDEPSIGLEPRFIDMVFEILRDLQHQEGKTILMVEQNAKKGLEFADLGYVLVSGQLALAGKGDDLLQNPEVGRLFLGG